MEREQYQTEIRDLQDQLSEMHDELDSAKKSASDEEKDGIMAVRHLPHYNGKKNISCESFDFQQQLIHNSDSKQVHLFSDHQG